MVKRFILCLWVVLWAACRSEEPSVEKKMYDLRNGIVDDLLENNLPFWMEHSVDSLHGGFYGGLAFDGTPDTTGVKGGVLNARILWTFSAAYRLFDSDGYKQLADRAQRYFLDHFIDKDYDGVYWTIEADGTPIYTSLKQTYAIAYAIYGLSEHYRATGNGESLAKAQDLFRLLEGRVRDTVRGGYLESFTREWQQPEMYGYDGKGVAAKSMNTHIHVLEAYANLFRVWKNDSLKSALRSTIDIVMDTMYDARTHHLKVFMDKDWNSLEDIDSYGHDIETAWLAVEAAHVLGDASLEADVRRKAVAMVDVVLAEGMNPGGFIMYERNGVEYHRDSQWWCQAEAVTGCIDAWQTTKDVKYVDAACKIWRFIDTHLIDREHGEWYGYIQADGQCIRGSPKASLWRCPYHNCRLGFEMYERFK